MDVMWIHYFASEKMEQSKQRNNRIHRRLIHFFLLAGKLIVSVVCDTPWKIFFENMLEKVYHSQKH